MRVQLYTAEKFESLFHQLMSNIFIKHKDIRQIFKSPIIFTNNSFSQSYLEEKLMLNNKDTSFIGNIHFLEWSPSLNNFLEPDKTLWNPSVWQFMLALFFYENWKNPQKNRELHNIFMEYPASSQISDFLPLGKYYYQLFKEYEVYFNHWLDIKAMPNSISSKLVEDIFQLHQKIYTLFFHWLNNEQYKFLGKRMTMVYPYPMKCKQQYSQSPSVHLFLPQSILLSQLEIFKEVFSGKDLNIYILHKIHLDSGFYKKTEVVNHLVTMVKKLDIPLEHIILPHIVDTHTTLPYRHYFTVSHRVQEYQTILVELLEGIKEEASSLLNQFSIVLPKSTVDKLEWQFVFSPYQQHLPYHKLFEEEKNKHYNIYELFLKAENIFTTKASIESIESFLKDPLSLYQLEVSYIDVVDFIENCKKQGVWGEREDTHYEQSLYYYLSEYSFAHILDREDIYLDNQSSMYILVKYTLDILEKVFQQKFFDEKQDIHIEEAKDFFEWLLPSSIWKDMDDNYVRKDILDILDFLNILEQIIPFNPINSGSFIQIIKYLNKIPYKAEDLSYAKNKGVSVGEITNLEAVPIKKLLITGYSENYEMIPIDIFHKEGVIKYFIPETEEILRYTIMNQFLEMMDEAQNTTFSYTCIDDLTQEEVQPHFLLEQLNIEQKTVLPYVLKSETLNKGLPHWKFIIPEISIKYDELTYKDIKKFLENPLEFILKKYWGNSTLLYKTEQWQELPFFFHLSYKYQKKLMNQGILDDFYAKILNEFMYIPPYQQKFKGLLSNTQYNAQQSQIQVDKVRKFLYQVHNQSAIYGHFYKHIYVGEYEQKHDDKFLLILPPHPLKIKNHKQSIPLISSLEYVYILKTDDIVTYTVPLAKELEEKQILDTLVRIFIIFLATNHPVSMQLRLLSINKNNPDSIIEKQYSYTYQQIENYIQSTVELMHHIPTYPYSFSLIYEYFSEKKLQVDFLDTLSIKDLENYIQEKLDTDIDSLNIFTKIPPIQSTQTTVEEIQQAYGLLFKNLVGKNGKV